MVLLFTIQIVRLSNCLNVKPHTGSYSLYSFKEINILLWNS